MNSENTKAYTEKMEDMTVCVLGVENGDELVALSRKLVEHGVPCHLWIENPEEIPTALATAPVNKDTVTHLLGNLKLLR